MLHKNTAIQWQCVGQTRIDWKCESSDCWVVEIYNAENRVKRIEMLSDIDSFVEMIQQIFHVQSKMFTVEELIKLLNLSVYIDDLGFQVDAYLAKSLGNTDETLKFGHLLSSDGTNVIFDVGIDDEEVERTFDEFRELYKGLVWHVRDFDLL